MTSEVTSNDIASAAAEVDKMSLSTAESTDDGKKDPKTVTGMLAAMTKHSDGTNVMKESIKVCDKIYALLCEYSRYLLLDYLNGPFLLHRHSPTPLVQTRKEISLSPPRLKEFPRSRR